MYAQNIENELKSDPNMLVVNPKCPSTPGTRSMQSLSQGVGALSYHGLTYRIETVKGCIKKEKSHKCILNNVR